MDALLCCMASNSHFHFAYVPMISEGTPTCLLFKPNKFIAQVHVVGDKDALHLVLMVSLMS
jgi:hypothetical protein